MKVRLRVLLLNLGLIAASVVLGLGLGEVAVRNFPGVLSEEARLRLHWARFPAAEATSRGDPYIGYLNRARYRGEVRGNDAVFTYSTDEHGFRNRPPWPPKAEVVVVGDSMSFGFGVSDDETWSSVVAGRLSRSRLINLGLAGAAPQQYTRIYEKFGRALEPKLLIYGLFPGNDLLDARTFDDWLHAGSPGNYLVWRTTRDGPPGPRFARQSYLLALVNQVAVWRRAQYGGQTMACSDGRRLQLVPRLLAGSAQSAAPGHPAFELVIQAVEAARRQAEQTDAAFLVLLFPTKEEVYLPLRSARAPMLVASFVAEFQKRGIPYLDLTPHFQQRSGECLFFEIDGHPNASGYRLIADVLLKHLRERAPVYGLADWN